MIRLENVSKRYHMGDVTVVALEDVSLEVDRGEFVVVLGPSGSGKTTLLNLIGALDAPTEGRVFVDGKSLSGTRQSRRFQFRRETVSFIFQTFNLFPSLTAYENVQFVVDMGNKPNSNGTAAAVLRDVGLNERANHFPHELSGGEQQRVAIARALATGNPVLLADEPTGELDFATGIQILELLKAQAEKGKIVIVVTHNREISRIADRVIELSSGRIVSDGPPRDGTAAIADLQW
ncbi:MAG: ABC transporter ATP-binding protein [Anaerolineae bacterium]|nr:ABC transporter ATP-binding protein [Anaerolineae bacterium]